MKMSKLSSVLLSSCLLTISVMSVGNSFEIEVSNSAGVQDFEDKRIKAERLSTELKLIPEDYDSEQKNQKLSEIKSNSQHARAYELFKKAGNLASIGTESARIEAIEIYKECLLLWGEKERKEKVLTLIGIANNYSFLNQEEAAIEYYLKSLNLLEGGWDLELESICLSLISHLYRDLAYNKEALFYATKALNIYRQQGLLEEQANTLQSIAIIYQLLEQYPHALTAYQEALSISLELQNYSEASHIWLIIGHFYLDWNEPEKAEEAYLTSISIYDNNTPEDWHKQKEQASRLRIIGSQYEDELQNKEKAYFYYQKALNIYFNILENSNLEASEKESIISSIASIYGDLDNFEKEAEYLIKSLDIDYNLAEKNEESGYLDSAHDYYAGIKFTLNLYFNDKQEEANILYKMGNLSLDLGLLEQAKNELYEALDLYIQLKDIQGEILCYDLLGLAYQTSGEWQKALNYYTKNISLLEEKIKDIKLNFLTLESIGTIYESTNNIEEAIKYYERALILFKQNEDKISKIQYYSLLSHVDYLKGDINKAIVDIEALLEHYMTLLKRKRTLLEQDLRGESILDSGDLKSESDYIYLETETDRETLISHRLELANLYLLIEKPEQAMAQLEMSLNIILDREIDAEDLIKTEGILSILDVNTYRTSEIVPITLASIFETIGYVFSDFLHYEVNNYLEPSTKTEAKNFFLQKSLDYQEFSYLLSVKGGDLQQQSFILYNIASIKRLQGNLDDALTNIEKSTDIIENLRTNIISPTLRQSYFATVNEYYELYINILMELHKQDPSRGYDVQAFHVSERSRARTLLELLTEANANIKEGVEPQLLAQEKSLQGQLDATEKQRLEINNNPDSTDEQKSAIDQKQQTLLEQYQNLQTEIRRKSPKYADLKYPQPLTLEQVQQEILDEDTVLLQYSLGEERSYVWVVTKEGMNSYQLPSQKEIEKRANNLLKFTTQSNPKAFVQAVTPLSKVILDPVKDKLTKKRILVVADGVLQYIPFAALTLPEKQQPLITNYEIINLPSSSSLATIRNETQARKSAPKALAILADPVFSLDDERVQKVNHSLSPQPSSDLGSRALQRSVRSLEDGKFDPLPGTRQEAEAILKLVPEDTQKTSAFDFDANLSTATNPQLSQYRIVHFATHGILNTESPELSGVVLSLVDEKGNTINGLLRLNEIFNLNLPAEIVVVSACETGLGKEIKGEGLVGLTRGFMYAGSPRVLVSLWKVDDEATAEIMTRFYRLMLEKNLSPAEALREAQLEMQQETKWKSPYYWAAFVLQGEWR